MATFELYSKRQKREKGGTSDVYVYSQVPNSLRVQIVHIWWDAIGNPAVNYANADSIASAYGMIVRILRREYGVFHLVENNYRRTLDPFGELSKFFLDSGDVSKVFDVIELSFKVIDGHTRQHKYMDRYDSEKIADNAIRELNERFKEHSIGYYYENKILMRVDLELIHKEAVMPALTVLRQSGYESAEKEFLSAHEHYRTGKNSQALIDCYKAFESVMKIVCTKRKWDFDKTKAAAHLVDVCLSNGLIPTFWQSHFTGLRQMLEAAIPAPRNKAAGHGAGALSVPEPSNELAGYVLHMTAATILFLTEAEKNTP